MSLVKNSNDSCAKRCRHQINVNGEKGKESVEKCDVLIEWPLKMSIFFFLEKSQQALKNIRAAFC